MSERFRIVEGDNCCFLIDNTGELEAIPFDFSFQEAREEDREALQNWLDYLNSG